MKKIVIVCNTYYQLILAMQIKKTIKEQDYVTVIMSDHSNHVEKVFERVRKLGIFDAVFFVKNKKYMYRQKGLIQSQKRSIGNFKDIVFGVGKLYDFENWDCNCDELIFFNPDIGTHILFSKLYKANPHILVSRYEEGILSYDTVFDLDLKMRFVYKIRKFMKHANLMDCVESFYCVNPELYFNKEKTRKIPAILAGDKDFTQFVAMAFDINKEKLIYKEKFVFFSSVYDFEGANSVGELELIKQIADVVGRDNLLVKVHPRDDKSRFEEAGIKVDQNSSVPWEAIQLNYNFDNHIFLTTTSGSVLSVSAIVENAPKTFFMYDLCKRGINERFEQSIRMFEKIYHEKTNSFLVNVKKVDDLKEIADFI